MVYVEVEGRTTNLSIQKNKKLSGKKTTLTKLFTFAGLQLHLERGNWKMTKVASKRYSINFRGSLALLVEPKQKNTRFIHFPKTNKPQNPTTIHPTG